MTSGVPHLRILPLDAEIQEPAAKKKLPPGLYRPTYACRKCKRCKSRKTCKSKKEQKVIWFRKMINGVRYFESTGCTSLRNAIEVADQLRDEWERQSVGLKRRGRMSIEEAKEKFRKYLSTQNGSDDYIETQMGYLDDVLVAAGVRFVDELEEEVFADWLPIAKEKKLRARGKNVRLYVLRRFGGWLSDKGLAELNPFALLRPYSEKMDRAHVRRAMWPRECERFLKAALMRPVETARRTRVNAGLSIEDIIPLRREGRVRSLIYRVISQTGLRRKEITLLRVGSVDLDQRVIWLPQEVAKSGMEQCVLVNSDLKPRLEAYISTLVDQSPEAPLFPSTRLWNGKREPRTAVPTSKTFDKDLHAAGLPKKDSTRGRVLDVHALRVTCITHLRMAGVPLDIAKRLARHSDIRLTENIYTDAAMMGDAEREAAEMLVPERRRQRFVPEVR